MRRGKEAYYGFQLCSDRLWNGAGYESGCTECLWRNDRGSEEADSKEPLNKSSSAVSGSFSQSVQFQKREILRSRCRHKPAYGCGIPLAGTHSIPPLLEPSSGEKSLARSSCRLNQSFLRKNYCARGGATSTCLWLFSRFML